MIGNSVSNNFPSNPPFGQQPEGQAPSAQSGAAPQQPAWGSPQGGQPGQAQQPQWQGQNQQPGQQQWQGQQAGATPYGYQGAPAASGPAAAAKLARWLFVGGFGLLAVTAILGLFHTGGSVAVIFNQIFTILAWGALAFGSYKVFDIVDASLAKNDK